MFVHFSIKCMKVLTVFTNNFGWFILLDVQLLICPNRASRLHKNQTIEWVSFNMTERILIFLDAFYFLIAAKNIFPANIYLFKVNNRNTGKRYEIYLKLTIKTTERRHWRRSGVVIVDFEHIWHFFPMFLLLTLKK